MSEFYNLKEELKKRNIPISCLRKFQAKRKPK